MVNIRVNLCSRSNIGSKGTTIFSIMQVESENCIKNAKNLHMSEKSCTFAVAKVCTIMKSEK